MHLQTGDRRASRIKAVYLDGKRLEYCDEFNTTEGWASIWVVGQNGKIKKVAGRAPVRRIVYGVVSFQCRDGYMLVGQEIVPIEQGLGFSRGDVVGLLFAHLAGPQLGQLMYFGHDGQPIREQ